MFMPIGLRCNLAPALSTVVLNTDFFGVSTAMAQPDAEKVKVSFDARKWFLQCSIASAIGKSVLIDQLTTPPERTSGGGIVGEAA